MPDMHQTELAVNAPMPRAKTRPRRVDVLGIVALCVGAVAVIPTLTIFLMGLDPDMNAIWWLLIVALPLLAIVGGMVLLIGVIGVIVAARRQSRLVISVVAIVLGVLMVLPIATIWSGVL